MTTRNAFRPSTLPDATPELRAEARALGIRCGSNALRNASKCWTISRAALDASIHAQSDELSKALGALASRAAGIGHNLAASA